MSRHERAQFVGRVPNEATPALYATADVFATACSKESFGLTVLEAMACGVPVVGPRAGGIAEVVAHQSTGLLFAPGDPAAFAQAVVALLQDAGLRQRLGAAGLAAARERTWAHGAQAMLEVWEECRGCRR